MMHRVSLPKILAAVCLVLLFGGPTLLPSSVVSIIRAEPIPRYGQRADAISGPELLAGPWYVLAGSEDYDFYWMKDAYSSPFDVWVTFPSELTILRHTYPGGTVYFDQAQNRFHWTGTYPGGSVEWQLYVEFLVPCAPNNRNLGYVTAVGEFDGPVDNESGPYIVQWPDLQTSSKTGPTTVQSGGQIPYEINLHNTGDIASTIVISDTIPSLTSYVASSAWASKGAAQVSAGVLTWSEEMAPDEIVTISFRVTADTAGLVVNHLVIDEGLGICREPYTRSLTTTVSILPTVTPSRTPTRSPTPTPSATPTWTRTPTSSATPTRTATPTPSTTPTLTYTPTRTRWPTASATPTRTRTPTAIPCQDLIVNGGFELGLTGWRAWTTGGFVPNASVVGGLVVDGVRSVRMGTDEVIHRSGISHLSQDIFVPANMQDVFLHFDYLVQTDELTPINRLFDWFQFEVLDATSGTALIRLPAVGVDTGWVHERVDLNGCRGRWLRFHFQVMNDGWMPTQVFIDGVHLCDGVLAVGPTPTPGFVYKESYGDYAPRGVPDFDQRQAGWEYPPGSGVWAYCGPVAAANSLWWFDSKFESNPQDPSIVNDNYTLLQPYGPWDDHDSRNVCGFIEDLAFRMDTCGQRTNPNGWAGTYVNDLRDGIVDLLKERGLLDSYTVTLRRSPSYEWVASEVERCEDVLLLVGFWQQGAGGWQRVGGHFVTVVGVDVNRRRLAVSDPVRNVTAPGAPEAHNDAGTVSHDIYTAVASDSPGGAWALQGYATLANPRQIFRSMPLPAEADMQAALQGIITEVEYAVAVSPVLEDADAQAPPPVIDMYWKGEMEAYPDFALAGVPDFDQRQADWQHPDTESWSHCGPIAVANSLWWFDSRFEPNPVPPPEINDGYPLVEAYGEWDDHDARNAEPLVTDLAQRMDTNGQRTGGTQQGTRIEDMAKSLRTYLIDKGLVSDYTITLRKGPTFDWVHSEVRRCEDVILLLGYWELQPEGWRRIGGHYVTATGVGLEPDPQRIAVSDPFRDLAEEQGAPGRVAPSPPHNHPQAPPDEVHNNAAFICHDVYRPVGVNVPDASFGLQGYVRAPVDVINFVQQNVPDDLDPYSTPTYRGGGLVTSVDYAIAVSPASETVTIRTDPDCHHVRARDLFVLDVVIDAGSQPMDSAEVHLNYDPSYLQVVDMAGNPVAQVEAGPDLLPVVMNSVNNSTGQIDYMAGILGGSLQGRVLVATVRFKAIRETGTDRMPISFDWLYPRRTDVLLQGNSVLGKHWDGHVTIDPASVILQGSVALQGRGDPGGAAWQVPLAVTLYEAGSTGQEGSAPSGQLYGVTTDAWGHFVLPDLDPGTYDISAKNPHTLGNVKANVALEGGETSVGFGVLLEGDFNNDNIANMTDFSGLSASYGKHPGDVGWDSRADLNGDALVDDADVNLLRANMGRYGDIALSRRMSELRLSGPALLSTEDGVSLSLLADKPQVALGETVTIEIRIDAGAQSVAAAEVHLVFDPAQLMAVDGAGQASSMIEGGTVLPVAVLNQADNHTGTIAYGAGDLLGGVSGAFTLATVRFRAIGSGGNVVVRFASAPGETNDVASDGVSVLDWLQGLRIHTGPTPEPVHLCIPLIWKGL